MAESLSKSNNVIRCLVVDDEPIAREGIKDYIHKLDFLEFFGECSSALEAADALRSNTIDLMFIDIQMPHLTGIEFVETLDHPPMTIFTTAYSEYALDGFRLQAVDYLMKPITFQRFFKAALKAQEIFNLRNNYKEDANGEMYVRQGDSFVKIIWTEILYAEGMQNYMKLHFRDRTLTIHQTMASLEEMLPKDSFFRIHKSYLVNTSQIEFINGNRIFIHGKELPISRYRREELLNSVVYKNLISK